MPGYGQHQPGISGYRQNSSVSPGAPDVSVPDPHDQGHHTGDVLPDGFNQAIGPAYLELSNMTAPAAVSGGRRVFSDLTIGLSVRKGGGIGPSRTKALETFWADPREYGAKGDGVTFDDSAFSTMLSEQRMIWLPPAVTFRLQGTLLFTGGNCGYTVVSTPGYSGHPNLQFASGVTGIQVQGQNHVFKGITIASESPASALGSDDGFLFDGTGLCSYENIVVRNFGRHGTNWASASSDNDDNILTNVFVIDCVGNSYNVVSGGFANNENTFIHCHAFRPGGLSYAGPSHGFYDSASHNVYYHPRVEGRAGSGDDFRMGGLASFVDFPYCETGTNTFRFLTGSADNYTRVKGRYALPSFVFDTSAARYNNVVDTHLHELAGKGIKFSEGSSPNQDVSGNTTLVGGTKTVSTIAAKSTSHIILSRRTPGGTLGNLSYTVVNATSFTINSDSATETSSIDWLIVDPA